MKAAMPPSQNPRVQPHFINLSQWELSIAQSTSRSAGGKWSCKRCNREFNDSLPLVTHILTSCDDYSSLPTFSTRSAIHICMLLDERGSLEMFQSYIRVASENADIRRSGVDSEVAESEAIISRGDDGLVEKKEAGDEPVWWVGEEEAEEEEDVGSANEEEESAELEDHQPTHRNMRKSTVEGVRPSRNQESPARPPHSLSAEAKLEWTFRRDRK